MLYSLFSAFIFNHFEWLIRVDIWTHVLHKSPPTLGGCSQARGSLAAGLRCHRARMPALDILQDLSLRTLQRFLAPSGSPSTTSSGFLRAPPFRPGRYAYLLAILHSFISPKRHAYIPQEAGTSESPGPIDTGNSVFHKSSSPESRISPHLRCVCSRCPRLPRPVRQAPACCAHAPPALHTLRCGAAAARRTSGAGRNAV